MDACVIVAARRTPSGRLLGGLCGLTAPELGAAVIRAVVKDADIRPGLVSEVIMGNVVSAGIGQNPARQAAIRAGLPVSTAALTVNKVCASGLKAVAIGADAIRLGNAGAVVAGGMESMSNAPFIIREMRKGRRMGDSGVIDAMVYDGLRDCCSGKHMGELCELTVSRYGITRKEQDAFALSSHRKAALAARKGLFRDEIVPVSAGGAFVSEDETIRRSTDMRRLGRLAPVFKDAGTITAGNSPGLNDGAAALLLMTAKLAARLKIRPLAEIIGHATAHVDPKWYPVAPVRSVKALLKKTGMRLDEFDLIEENEAFAAQAIAVARGLSIGAERLNVSGGAIALGHPIGASGARILVTLVHALRQRGKRLGMATLCLGGGGAMSMAVRRTS
ncbi:MAG: thiolase family protein [Deltaproteobacteria bacterium]|nr:thiolase family protein [Deltaproteobacteria bacterium]